MTTSPPPPPDHAREVGRLARFGILALGPPLVLAAILSLLPGDQPGDLVETATSVVIHWLLLGGVLSTLAVLGAGLAAIRAWERGQSLQAVRRPGLVHLVLVLLFTSVGVWELSYVDCQYTGPCAMRGRGPPCARHASYWVWLTS